MSAKKKIIKLNVFILIILMIVFSGFNLQIVNASNPEVSVGSKEFTTQLAKGQLIIQLLEEHGFNVNDETGLGGTYVVREALETGEVDMYWEYTGTGLIAHLGYAEPITESEKAYNTVKEEDLEQNDIVWLPYAEQNDTYTVMMREEDAEELGIETISDLAEAINEGVEAPEPGEWVFASDHEYSVREDGYPGLTELYGFNFDGVYIMDMGITYGALRDGDVVLAMGFATDGRIAGFDLVNLEDDKAFHPVYNASLTVRKDTLEKYPEIENIYLELKPYITNEKMRNLNAKIDLEGYEPEEAAKEFLLEHDLISE